jgi:hypothetical protein
MPRESEDKSLRLRRLVELGQMGQQFFLVGHAAEAPADHLVEPSFTISNTFKCSLLESKCFCRWQAFMRIRENRT